MELIAHGWLGGAPLDQPAADRIEFDVLALGERLVIAHDAREAARRGPAPLADALALIAASGLALQADLKSVNAAEALGAALLARGLGERTIVSGALAGLTAPHEIAGARRSWTLPSAAAKSGPFGLSTRAARTRVASAAAGALERGACDLVTVDRRFVDAQLCARVHAAGGQLFAWTVDRAADVRRLAELGVDGLIVNDPAAAREALS